MTSCQIYDKTNLDTLNFSLYNEGEALKPYLSSLISNGPTPFFKNIESDVRLLAIGNHLIPISINRQEYENSYVCSPYTHYVGGALEKLNPKYHRLITPLLSLIKKLQLNHVVQINNWFFGTNLFDPLKKEEINLLTKTLTKTFPNHALIFRSLTKREPLQKVLTDEGYHLIASRPVFYLDTTRDEPFKARMFKSDLKLFKESPYEIVEGHTLKDSDIERCIALYNALYLEKYTKHSPQLTPKFLKEAIDCALLKVKAFKLEGQVEAVLGYFVKNGVATSPLFGYNPNEGEETGLYRQIATLLALEAKEKKLLLNQSAGATNFKTLRRGEKELESMAVYCDHLPFFRKLPWKLFKFTLNTFGAKKMLSMNI